MSKNNMAQNKAFTLVELLVVISIIALLLSVLMPALSAAREQGRSVVCGFRLRSLGSAMEMYANDNSGRYPYFRNSYPGTSFGDASPGSTYWVRWYEMLVRSKYNNFREYISVQHLDRDGTNYNNYDLWRNTFNCPTAIEKKLCATSQYSYVANFWILTSHKSNVPASVVSKIGGNYCSFTKSDFSPTSRTPMLMDGQLTGKGTYSFGQLPADTLIDGIQPVVQGNYGVRDPLGPFAFMDQIGKMHKNAGNFVFLDGHISKVPFKVGSDKVKVWEPYLQFNWMPKRLK